MYLKGLRQSIFGNMLLKFVQGQMRICRQFDRLLPKQYSVDGITFYREIFVPSFIKPNLKIYDIGGGKQPYFSAQRKQALNLNVVGLDIDANELALAPANAYDEVIVADIMNYQGAGDADIVLCQAVLEHVKDVNQAFAAIASILKPGGQALIFVPSRNAVFARLNLLLPEKIKTRLLFTLFPRAKQGQGFKSYYHLCTPRDFHQLAKQHGLNVTKVSTFYFSNYFSFFFPAYCLWRFWILLFYHLVGIQAAETFCMSMTKREGETGS